MISSYGMVYTVLYLVTNLCWPTTVPNNASKTTYPYINTIR